MPCIGGVGCVLECGKGWPIVSALQSRPSIQPYPIPPQLQTSLVAKDLHLWDLAMTLGYSPQQARAAAESITEGSAPGCQAPSVEPTPTPMVGQLELVDITGAGVGGAQVTTVKTPRVVKQ